MKYLIQGLFFEETKMEKNIIIETLEKIVGTDAIDFISGNILQVGTDSCKLSNDRGSVYGIAIELHGECDKHTVFEGIEPNYRKILNENDWKPIAEHYYPLYWGKDVNMGIRLFSHTKSMKSTGTLQLNNTRYKCLENHQIVYGAIPCINYKNHEDDLHKRYKDLMKTSKSVRGKDEVEMKDVNIDEE